MNSAAREVIPHGGTVSQSALNHLRSAAYAAVVDRPLLSIFIFAVLVRAITAYIFPGAIDTEGAEYARIANNLLMGNGYVGIAEDAGKQLFFPPLFPFLIAGVSLFTGDAEIAGRIVSVTMGALIALPTYYIAAKMYDRPIAILASLFIAANPFLIFMSSTVHCEMAFMALFLTALCFAFYATENYRIKTLLMSGAFYGMAYLVRPEAAVYLFIGAIIIFMYRLITKADGLFQAGAGAGMMICSFALVAAPYVVWLSLETGQFRIEGKSPLNIATATRIQAGEDPFSVQSGVDHLGRKSGVWNQPNIVMMKSNRIAVQDLVSYICAKTSSVIRNALRAFLFAPGSPILFLLAIIGLCAKPWTNISLMYRLHILCVIAVSTVATYLIFFNDARFYVLFVPFMWIWGLVGARRVLSWLKVSQAGFAIEFKGRYFVIRKGVMWVVLLVFMIGPAAKLARAKLIDPTPTGRRRLLAD